jgi:hypothetical protein
MNASRRSKIVVPIVSLLTAVAFAAQAQTPPPQGQGQPGQQPAAKQPPQARQMPPRPPGGGGPGPRGPDYRYAHGSITARDYGGHAYRGRLAWDGGRWRHEVHNGRNGWWWDVGGVWYYYPAPVEGPPTYVSEDFADDVVYAEGAPAGAYAPPPGPPPGAYYAAPPPPPPPPPPDPAASAVGGAVVGGLLGGLLTGRASGAAAGAVIGGATGAIAGATAASRPGYYLAQGGCYYRYPSGQYVPADPRWCY